jgi:hypothetical protein
MKFRIFADSWAWVWGNNRPGALIKSKSMVARDPTDPDNEHRCSLVKIILESMGHEVDISRSRPGMGVGWTTGAILDELNNLPEDHQGDEIWLHMISSPVRDVRLDKLDENNINFSNIDEFFKTHDQEITRHLQRISDRLQDIHSNINVIPLGGHVVLPKHCFDAITNCSPKLKFGCEWILSVVEELDAGDYPMSGGKLIEHIERGFQSSWNTKWNGVNDPGVGPFKIHRWNQAYRVFLQPAEHIGTILASGKLDTKPDLEFVEFMNDIFKARVSIFVYKEIFSMYPDNGHLGWAGHARFADWILLKAEELGFIVH